MPSIPSRDLVAERSRDPLATPVVGSSASDLISPCRKPEPHPTHPPAGERATVAVAISGGGFRATLAGLGVLQLLADAGLLKDIRYSSSVSGGSVANGLFAHHYDELAAAGFTGEAFDRIVVQPTIATITGRSFAWKLLSSVWRIVGPKTRTNVLADSFADWFVGDQPLAQLTPQCRFIFNAANLTTGVRFTLERDIVGDYVSGHANTANTTLRLADAMAASAAFPIAFNPLHLKNLNLPCGEGLPPKLLDGGVYDNMGLEAIDGLHHDELIVALNAGGLFYVKRRYGWIPLVKDFLRLNSVLYRQSTALRRHEMVDRFRAWEDAEHNHAAKPAWARRGVLFGLTTTFEDTPANPDWTTDRPEHPELIQQLARIKTGWARFDRATCSTSSTAAGGSPARHSPRTTAPCSPANSHHPARHEPLTEIATDRTTAQIGTRTPTPRGLRPHPQLASANTVQTQRA